MTATLMDDIGMAVGSVELCPLRGFPEGKARIRIRPDEAVTVYIRPPEGGIRRFTVQEIDGEWWPCQEVETNAVVPGCKEKQADGGDFIQDIMDMKIII